jgi:hypothetical protein
MVFYANGFPNYYFEPKNDVPDVASITLVDNLCGIGRVALPQNSAVLTDLHLQLHSLPALSPIPVHYPALRALCFCNCNLRNNHVLLLLDLFPHINDLWLNENPALTEAGLRYLVSFKTLAFLAIDACTVDADDVASFLPDFANLRTLQLTQPVDEETMQSLTEAAKQTNCALKFVAQIRAPGPLFDITDHRRLRIRINRHASLKFINTSV